MLMSVLRGRTTVIGAMVAAETQPAPLPASVTLDTNLSVADLALVGFFKEFFHL